MQVTLAISETIKQVFITIHGPKETQAIHQLKQSIEQLTNQLFINGYQQHRLVKLPVLTITRFYTADKQVYCETPQGTYLIHERLYELTALLSNQLFLRISSSEIIRISCIKNFELTKWGSFQVNLTTGTTTYASRRYSQQIRKAVLK